MVICTLCNAKFNNINGLAKHLTAAHKISKQEYYDTYIREVDRFCVCGAEKKFRNLGEGYRIYCSPQCRSNHIEPISYWKDKRQPQEMIDKRRNTMVERYGVANGYLTKHSVAERYKGFVCRSKYEKMFVDFSELYGWELSVPEKISYTHEGTSRYYYPDFYIEKLDLLVEIKSDWTWKQNLDLNISKMVCTIEQGYNIVFLDEEHGITNSKLWDELNEYLRSFEESG